MTQHKDEFNAELAKAFAEITFGKMSDERKQSLGNLVTAETAFMLLKSNGKRPVYIQGAESDIVELLVDIFSSPSEIGHLCRKAMFLSQEFLVSRLYDDEVEEDED